MAKPKRNQRTTAARTTRATNGQTSAKAPAQTKTPLGAGSSKASNPAVKANASEQPARAMATRPAQRQRRRYSRRVWWQSPWTMVGSAAVTIGLIVATFVYVANMQGQASAAGIGSPVPAGVFNAVTHVPASVFVRVGAGPDGVQMEGTPPNTPLLTNTGLPEVFYVGGEYCPYCAAQRWGLVVALSQFGTFKNLHLMKSSHTDVYPDTNTFTFYQSSYSSPYITFVPAEVQDRDNNNLQKLTKAQEQVFTTYDAPPYTAPKAMYSFPFVSYGNAYITTEGAFLPSPMQGKSWQEIASGLNDPNNPVTQHIIGLANTMIAAICILDQQQPGSVCQTPTIQQIEKKLPKR